MPVPAAYSGSRRMEAREFVSKIRGWKRRIAKLLPKDIVGLRYHNTDNVVYPQLFVTFSPVEARYMNLSTPLGPVLHPLGAVPEEGKQNNH
jgi:hypothetical protein